VADKREIATVTAERLTLRVHAIVFETDAVRLLELCDPDAHMLPPFTPGAHLDIALPDGLVRSYSLIGDPADATRYRLGVQREPQSRGGSRLIHDQLRVGTLLSASGPRNNFPLVEDAPTSVLIAGGIGITPILLMVDRLSALGRPFVLHYGARERRTSPFLSRLARHTGNVRMAFSREPDGRRLDIAAIITGAAADAELYCCGPSGMLDAFAAATRGRDPARVHVEHFSAAEPPSVEGGFCVTLARSGRTIPVPPGMTILDALVAAGVNPPCSCLEGVCGTCETRVIEGLPDHRDRVLSPQERAANKTMMLCCSGAKSELLVLDM
jgi:vanillate O-demethylase ferredoxin subunit